MLRILTSKEIWRPIRVMVPEDGGWKIEDGDVLVRYPITRDDVIRFSTLREQEVLPAVVELIHGWRGPFFTDTTGQAEPFSAEALLDLLRLPTVNDAIQTAIAELASGRAAARNFPSGSAGS